MQNELQLKLLPDLSSIKKIFEQYISADLLEGYRLKAQNNDPIIIGVSGGADSAVLTLFAAAYLVPIYNNITFLFTDTGAEPESCHDTLNALEAMTNEKIVRILPEFDFFQSIENYNGFLPSSLKRWCTNTLKIKPLKDYIERNFDGACWNLAGIRADESDREGITLIHNMENDGKSIFPFVDLGINKKMVFDILHKTIGPIKTYRYRSRSGCFTCFHQRNSEVIGMLFHDPINFRRTEELEKLTDADRARFPTLDNFTTTHGLNVPDFVDIRTAHEADIKPYKKIVGKAGESLTGDLFSNADDSLTENFFGSTSIFIAHALFVKPELSTYGDSQFTPGTYGAEFITFSTSMPGLNTSLANYYQFKETTPHPYQDIKDMKIVISHLVFKKGLIDTKPPSKESYTWKSHVALQQIKHIVTHAMATLTLESCDREIEKNEKLAEETNSMGVFLQAEDNIERYNDQRLLVDTSRTGEIFWQGIYHPKPSKASKGVVQFDLEGFREPETKEVQKKGKNLEYDIVPKACIICSI